MRTKIFIKQRLFILLTLLLGAVSGVYAEDRLYVDAINFEPGEEKQLAVVLENSQDFYGFQVDITLPEGLEFVLFNNKAKITLSSRTDDSYSVVSNLLSNRDIRLGAFSVSHTPIADNDGALFYVKVQASDSFAGGTISLSNVLFSNWQNQDVKLSDYSVEIGTVHNDRFYIPDFKIAVGETKTISLVLDNETPFTAFQTDIYLPNGLNIVDGTFALTSRGEPADLPKFSVAATSASSSMGSVTVSANEVEKYGSVTLTANPNEDYEFVNWTVNGEIVSTQNPYVATIMNDVEFVANFKQESYIVVGKEYRIKEVTTGLYLNAANTTAHEFGTIGGVNLVSFANNNNQIYKFETSGANYKLKNKNGYYIYCQQWNVDALTSGTELRITETTYNGKKAIKINVASPTSNQQDGAFKVETVGGTTYPFCDAENSDIATWVLEPLNSNDDNVSLSMMSEVGVSGGSSVESDHIISVKSFTDGRVRIACFSPSNSVFSGNSGALLNFDITATGAAGETEQIELRNQIFSTSDSKEYVLDNSQTTVTVERAFVQEISLDYSSLALIVGDSHSISATVYPSFASTKDLTWSSSNDDVVSVSPMGLVTAVGIGNAVVTASAIDGSGVTASCEVTVSGIPVGEIILSKTNVSLMASETITITTIISPSNASDKSIVWSNSDDNIATVDDNGNILAISVGETIVTATSVSNPEVSASCLVKVIPTPVSQIILTPSEVSIEVGEKISLNAEVLPDGATTKSLIWETSSQGVVEIDENGEITALALGSVTVYAKATDGSGVMGSAEINVVPTPVEEVNLLVQGSTTLKDGESVAIVANVYPEAATNKNLNWFSSDSSIASVVEGVVTAHAKTGKVQILAVAHNGIEASVEIEVVPTLAEIITMEQSSATLKALGTLQLSVDFMPLTTTDKSLTWSSTAEDIATVTENGFVTGLSVGECDIIATTVDGSNLSTICHVVVAETAAESIEISPKGDFTLSIGEQIQFSALVLPETTTDKSVTWVSQTSGVVIDQNGLATAVDVVENNYIKAINSAGQTDYVYITVLPTLVSSIETDKQNVELKVGESVEVITTVYPEDATYKTLSWESNNISVATVNNNGVITAVSIGDAVINVKATDGSGVTQSINVSVIPTPVEEVNLLVQGSTTLKDGESVAIVANVYPETATNKDLNWFSSDSSIASVVEGVVTAHAKTGKVQISAVAHNGIEASVEIEVVPTPVDTIIVSATSNMMFVGESMSLSVQILPETATYTDVTWSSSDASVLYVNQEGLVSALAQGSAYVIVENIEGVRALYEIEVKPILVTSVVIPENIELEYGAEYELIPEIYPEDATNKNLLWYSSNSAIAVIADGKICANGVGSATLTCTTTDGSNVSASCVVNVVKYVTSISLSEHNLELYEGETFKLSAEIEPIDASNKSIVWESSNENVVIVDQSGIIEAVSEGSAEISVNTTVYPFLTDICNVLVVKESGIESVTIGNTTVLVDGHNIIVKDCSDAILYDVSGIVIDRQKALNGDIHFSVINDGIYIVNTGKYSLKVLIK